jgi:hypothetical protein
MPAESDAAESTVPPPATNLARPSLACQAGRLVQAVVLAVAVAAVALKLLQANLELTFRYGGF